MLGQPLGLGSVAFGAIEDLCKDIAGRGKNRVLAIREQRALRLSVLWEGIVSATRGLDDALLERFIMQLAGRGCCIGDHQWLDTPDWDKKRQGP